MKRSPSISLNQAAELIGCSDETVRRLAHAHVIDGWRLGDRGWMRVYRASVDRYLAERKRANFHGSKTPKSVVKSKPKTKGGKR